MDGRINNLRRWPRMAAVAILCACVLSGSPLLAQPQPAGPALPQLELPLGPA